MRATSKLSTAKELIFYALGILLIAGFTYLYWTRFILDPVMPPAIRYLYFDLGTDWAILANAGVFILFLLFLPYRGQVEWRSKGTFAAFILALFAEMFGIPLMVYILSPLLPDLRFTQVGRFLPVLMSLNPRYFGWPGAVLGAWMTLMGMLLVMAGWVQVHRATGLVTTGLYRYVRHPQYLGLFLIITGWILHWATWPTLLMYPILLVIYYRLARQEEKTLEQAFGTEYKTYRQRTPMFVPLLGRKS
jgi:protein-S-isoprenylcysteine O-methyltransferase Ste14